MGTLLPLSESFTLLWQAVSPNRGWYAVLTVVVLVAAIGCALLLLGPRGRRSSVVLGITAATVLLSLQFFLQMTIYGFATSPAVGVRPGWGALAGLGGALAGVMAVLASRRPASSRGLNAAVVAWFGTVVAGMFAMQYLLVQMASLVDPIVVLSICEAGVSGLVVGLAWAGSFLLLRQLRPRRGDEARILLGVAVAVTGLWGLAAIPLLKSALAAYGAKLSIISIVWEVMLVAGGVGLALSVALWTVRLLCHMRNRRRGVRASLAIVGVAPEVSEPFAGR